MTKTSSLISLRFFERVAGLVLAFVFLLMALGAASGQSMDQEIPTPIRAANISATIAVRDLGDPRLTRHFYIFTGTPGDLLISVESKNLNGDVDIFTAGGFRPLVKTSLYASEVATKTTKSIYLRARQDLILRVEARSPNDDQGSYRIQFGGSFEPFSGEIAAAENATPGDETPTVSPSGKKGRRVSAVGARIDEPLVPVEEKAAGDQPTTETPVTPEKTEPVATRAEPARTARGRTPPRPRTPRRSRSKPAAKAEEPASEKTEPKATEPGAAEGDEKRSTPATQVEEGPRLIIETKDGGKMERSMSTVRRVVVDNGQIIVILRTGKIERVPMSNVARMSIEP